MISYECYYTSAYKEQGFPKQNMNSVFIILVLSLENLQSHFVCCLLLLRTLGIYFDSMSMEGTGNYKHITKITMCASLTRPPSCSLARMSLFFSSSSRCALMLQACTVSSLAT